MGLFNRFNEVKDRVGERWGERQSKRTSSGKVEDNKDVEKLQTFFIDTILKGETPVQYIATDMSVRFIFDWVDSIDIQNENKLYILKGYIKQYGYFVYFAFFGVDGKMSIESAKKCFSCKSESAEMKELFGDKYLYVSPIEVEKE